MSDITIHYFDELHCIVKGDMNTLMEVDSKFSFFVPGYKHMPLYKAGRWSGKVHLFSAKTGKFYRGLLPALLSWADDQGHSFDILEKAKFRPKVSWDSSWLDNWAKYGTMEPHQHQINYVDAIMQRNHSIVLAPTSAGKSYIVYLCVRYLLETFPDEKVLITVPSTLLCEQLLSDFKDYAVNWDADKHVQLMYNGKSKDVTHQCVISTWQTAVKFDKSWFKQFNFYFCDEAHQADSKCISEIVGNLGHAKMRTGLTGTLDGTKMHELELMGRFGSVIKKITTRELMDLGLVADLQIQCHRLIYSEEEKQAVSKVDYQSEIDYVVSNPHRNAFIAKTAANLPGNVLVLFNYVEKHGKPLAELIRQVAGDKKQVNYLSGETKMNDRLDIKANMEDETNVVTVGSYGVISTGVSIKNIDWIIFAHPFKSRIRNLQSIGRGLRLKPGKTGCGLIDIGDDFTKKSKNGKVKENHLYKHWVSRLEIYKSEEFDYEIIETHMVK